MKRCRYCHRVLKDAESIARGIGPVCYARLGKRSTGRKKAVHTSVGTEESITIEEWYESQKGSANDESIGFYDQGHSLCP